MRFLVVTTLLFILIPQKVKAQIETHWIDSSFYEQRDMGYFFTNRPLKNSEEGVVAFRNRWTRQTKNLYFCMYEFEKDSIALKYQATKTCAKHEYPTEYANDNIFYQIYHNLRIRKGIKSIIFIVPGYAKTFENQLKSYMFRLQDQYADILSPSTAIITFAWGDQSLAQFYYKGKRVSIISHKCPIRYWFW